jgi:hypothetical protein
MTVCAQLTSRDVQVLAWVGEQYVVPRDLLAVLLARTSGHQGAQAAGRVTDTVVDRTLRRWRDLRLARCRRYLVGEPASVWATATGLQVAGLSWRAWEPTLATLAHRHAVARVRAAIEGRDESVDWVCERELREGLGGRRSHLPDGVVESTRGRAAIEVELTAKTAARVRQIIAALLHHYDRVVYYATPRAAAVVQRAAAPYGRRVVVRPYPITGVRETLLPPRTSSAVKISAG